MSYRATASDTTAFHPPIQQSITVRQRLLLVLEILIIAAWALFMAAPYLNLDQQMVPIGREFPSAIQTHAMWLHARACGACAFWYGHTQGGYPAAVDPIGSMLHPLVIATTLGWGVLNGAKLALVASFFLNGVAIWWLCRVMGLGVVGRVWAGCMAVAAGHIAARMGLGAFSLVLSTASAALVLAPLLHFNRTGGSWRAAVVLAAMLALLLVSGNGYMQVATAFVLPAALLLFPTRRAAAFRLMQGYILVALLTLLFAAPMLVPFVHFLPNFAKDFDQSFSTAQPFSLVPLNLVIDNPTIYSTPGFTNIPYASHYASYVGWIPVVLACYGLLGTRSRWERQVVLFLAATVLLGWWVASAQPLEWLIWLVPLPAFDDFISGVRYTSFMAGVAVPPLLALSARGLERLLANQWLWQNNGRWFSRMQLVALRGVVGLMLVAALASSWSFSRQFIKAEQLPAEVPPVVDSLRSATLRWIEVPLGEHFFVEYAVRNDLKLAEDFFRTWHWRDHEQPPAEVVATRGTGPEGTALAREVNGVKFFTSGAERAYAQVDHRDGTFTPCEARGTGGSIDVTCSVANFGVLTVKENSWSGWQAAVNGEAVALRDDQWLSVVVPAGSSTVSFRYMPWDVPVGLALLLVGLLVGGYFWRKSG